MLIVVFGLRNILVPVRQALKHLVKPKAPVMSQSGICSIYITIMAMVFICSSVLCAGDYYVSPEGERGASGTREDPWSLHYACERAGPGDTVILLSGDYHGQRLEPLNSGQEGAPVVFRAHEPGQVRMTGASGRSGRLVKDHLANQQIVIAGVEHIHIKGIHVRIPDDRPYRWLTIDSSSGIEIRECRFRGGAAWGMARIVYSEQVRILDSDFSIGAAGGDVFLLGGSYNRKINEGGNMFQVHSSAGVVVEGNAFSKALHTLVQITPGREGTPSERVVFRGNVFHSGWSRNFENFAHPDTVLESNLFTNAYDGGRSAGSMDQVAGDRMIYRYNIIARNDHAPYATGPWSRTSHNVRYYHNVFYGNGEVAFKITCHDRRVQDVSLKNNMFGNNDPHGSNTHILSTSGREENLRLSGNVFHGGQSPNPSAIVHGVESWRSPRNAGTALSIEKAQSGSREWDYGRMFTDNTERDPLFEAPSLFDFSLQPASTLRGAALPLARTLSGGEGRDLPVDDTYSFYDGYGIRGEEGDLVAVGTGDNVARIEGIDRAGGILRLDRNLSWEEGDGVSFPWYGEGPDIGIYEHGDGDIRPSVQVLADGVDVELGQSVRLEAVVRGLEEPLEYRWQLGDDNVATGRVVEHNYGLEDDYGIRVRVTDARGRQAVGVGYVNVEAPDEREVLMHRTFDENDKFWHVHWQAYRPRKGASGGRGGHTQTEEGYLHVWAPEGGMLTGYTSPRNWDIDRYPTLWIRYRIKEGTPLALYVKAFKCAREGDRELYLAGTEASQVGEEGLRDDGEWHEAEFDVRRIREKYPEVDMLKGLHIGAVIDGARARDGDEYWLDEVYIGR